MKDIICIDLDHTILARTDALYRTAYSKALCQTIRSFTSETCVEHLEYAIEILSRKTSINDTLKDRFLIEFAQGNEKELENIAADLDKFHREVYRELQHYTSIIPEAIAFIQEAFRKDLDVVIATNPVYPLVAIKERLRWAGLSEYINQFLMITSMEDFHFPKPDPAYFDEILGKLGWPEDRSVFMIGDSLEQDIIPASKAGIPAFWLNDGRLPPGLNPGCSCGSFDDIFSWIEQVNDQPTAMGSLSVGIDLVSQLKSTPAVVDSICRSVEDDSWCRRPETAEWSLVEIMCHLRDTDLEVNLPRLWEAFHLENPFVASVDTDAWNQDRKYRQENGDEAVQEFIKGRSDLIDLLVSHREEWWTKSVRHSIFGPVCVAELIQFIMTHDRMHIRQAYKTLGKVRENNNLNT